MAPKGKAKAKAKAKYGATGGGPHYACLKKLKKMEIREKASFIEALTAVMGAEIEMANKYEIFSGQGKPIFFAGEETSFCKRQMKNYCADCSPWDVDILYIENGAQRNAFKLERPWTCTCCCFNRPVVDVKDAASGESIGSLRDPFACFDLTFSIRDPADPPETVLKASGGCCQWGLCCPLPCGPCAEVNFEIQDPAGEKVGELSKKVPGCCKFLFASDVDNYKVDFDKVEKPELKAMLMALVIFIDFRYFSDNRNDNLPEVSTG